MNYALILLVNSALKLSDGSFLIALVTKLFLKQPISKHTLHICKNSFLFKNLNDKTKQKYVSLKVNRNKLLNLLNNFVILICT